MVQRGVTGAVPKGSVGPNTATMGRPTAAATCIAPESLPTKRWHCDSSAGRSAMAVFPVKSIGGRRISVAMAAETLASEAVPKRMTSTSDSDCSRFARRQNAKGANIWRSRRSACTDGDSPDALAYAGFFRISSALALFIRDTESDE